MESTKGAKTLQEVLQGVLEQYKPEGIGDVDTDKIQKLFDGIGEIVDVTRAKTIRFWITVKANCCVEGGFLFSNYYESHTYDYPCDDVFFNPAVATGSDEERLCLQQEIDKWISGGGITRCQKKAKEDFDCIKSDGGARLVEDPLKK